MFHQGQSSPIPSPLARNIPSRNKGRHAYVESESESPQFPKDVSQKGTTRNASVDFPVLPPLQQIIDHDAPLAEFMRRISNSAQALAKRGYDSPDNDDSSTAENASAGQSRNPTTVYADESSIAATLREMMEDVLQKLQMQEAATKITEERMKITEERIQFEAQPLATMIATQPPSAPPQAHASQVRELLYQLARTAAIHGVETAKIVYQNTFCGGNLPTMPQLRGLVRDVDPVGNPLDPKEMWQPLIRPQEYPSIFCSTRP